MRVYENNLTHIIMDITDEYTFVIIYYSKYHQYFSFYFFTT